MARKRNQRTSFLGNKTGLRATKAAGVSRGLKVEENLRIEVILNPHLPASIRSRIDTRSTISRCCFMRREAGQNAQRWIHCDKYAFQEAAHRAGSAEPWECVLTSNNALVSGSTLAMHSSRHRMTDSLSKARARHSSWRCPSESVDPPSATRPSRPPICVTAAATWQAWRMSQSFGSETRP
jgi:hypothetical protein